MYVKGGSYSIFTGHDCSINLVQMDLSKKCLNTYHTTELNEKQKEILDDWFQTFEGKY